MEKKSYIKYNGYYLVDKEEFIKIHKYFHVNKDYKIWKRKVICDYLLNPYTTVEEEIYSKKELKKLNDLRVKKKVLHNSANKISPLFKEGTLVYLSRNPLDDSKNPQNYIKDTNEFKGVIYKKHISTLDIKIGHEIIKHVNPYYVSKRKIEKRKEIDIPDVYKNMNTKSLLRLLDYHRKIGYDYYNINDDKPTKYEVIKAELSKRENIKTKRERKKERQLLAKRKK